MAMPTEPTVPTEERKLAAKKLGITDDVDEQDMPDLELEVGRRFGWAGIHGSFAYSAFA
jgi:hypothetical protein